MPVTLLQTRALASVGRGSMRDARYRAQRTGLVLAGNLFMQVFHRLLGRRGGVPSRAARRYVLKRFSDLCERDLANAAAGYYPKDLLYATGWREYLRVLPEGLRDIPRVLRRAHRRDHADLPTNVPLEGYPAYYRRTFHWQTDGWLSARSARLYDPGVELLFGGTADVMRRMIIPDLADDLADQPAPRVLDLACGTGRFLRQLHAAMPRAQLTGLDLSPAYVAHARAACQEIAGLKVVTENAEQTSLSAGSFDAVTCIYLFHELPKDVRRRIMAEALRLVTPGGLFAVVDSPQHSDSPEMRCYLDNFPIYYHEPYFKGYVRDPLEDALSEVGFEVVDVRPAFVSKIVIARRPLASDEGAHAVI